MSSMTFPLVHALAQYEKLMHKLNRFLINRNQRLFHKAIVEYGYELRSLVARWETLPLEIRTLNKCIISVLKKANDPLILFFFKEETKGLKYD